MPHRLIACAVLLAAGSSFAAESGPVRIPVQPFVTLADGVRQPEGPTANPATGEFHVGAFDAWMPESTRRSRVLRHSREGWLLAQKDFGSKGLTAADIAARTTTAQTRFVQAGPHRFAYRELGPRGGTPLVLFNRLRGTMDHWDPAFVDRLAAERHVILFDHVGLARSTGPLASDYAGFAAGAAAFVRALGHAQVDALGFSFGGPVVIRMTLDQPSLVRRMVIAGSTPGFVPGDAPRNGPVPDKVWETAFKPVNDDEDFLYLFFSESQASRDAGRAYFARLQVRTDRFQIQVSEAGWKSQIAAAQGIATPETSLLGRLGEIRQPVLVANGNNDIMTPTYGSYAMFQALPHARLVLYPDSGHGFLFQYPEAFADEVLVFLR